MANDKKAERVRKPLSKEDIFAAKDINSDWLFVPEWDGDVHIRGVSVEERRTARGLAKQMSDNADEGVVVDEFKLACVTVAMATIEPKMSVADAQRLEKKSSGVVQRVFNEIMILSGFDNGQAARRRKDVEAGKANPTPSEGDFSQPPGSDS